MENQEKTDLLKVLHLLTQNYSEGSEVSDLANKKIVEILNTL